MEETRMNRNIPSIIIGLFLIVGGALLLLQTLNVLALNWAVVATALFLGGGLIFLGVYFFNREHWWALIPGCSMMGLGALIGLSTLMPESSGQIGAAIFLFSIGLSFWLIYAVRREFWWAIIPAGVMTSVAATVLASGAARGEFGGTVMLLGLSVTFLLVSVLPSPEGSRRWALIPAGILFGFAMLTFAASNALFNYFWPALLILAGIYLILRRWS
jgi:hypothetical protein